MKKTLCILLTIISLVLLGASVKAADVYSNYNIEELKKIAGITDYEGLRKAYEDIKANYYTNRNSPSNKNDNTREHYDIIGIAIHISKYPELPSFILCSAFQGFIVYECKGDNFRFRTFIDNPKYLSPNSQTRGGFVNGDFYFTTAIFGHPEGGRFNFLDINTYKYENGQYLKIARDAEFEDPSIYFDEYTPQDIFYESEAYLEIKDQFLKSDDPIEMDTDFKDTSNFLLPNIDETRAKINDQPISKSSKFLADVSQDQVDKISLITGNDYKYTGLYNESHPGNNTGSFLDVSMAKGLLLTEVNPYYNYAIFTYNFVDYGQVRSKYILVERTKIDGVYKLFPIYISSDPFEISYVENLLGYKLSPDYLEGLDENVLRSKAKASDIAAYIDGVLKENDFVKGEQFKDEEKMILYKAFKDFEENNNAYQLTGEFEINPDLLRQIKIQEDEILSYQNYLQGLGLRFSDRRPNNIYINMEANSDNRYIFSFVDLVGIPNACFHIYLKDLGLTMTLTAADIEKLAAEETAFEIGRIDGDLALLPLSKNRESLPTNIKMDLGQVFSGNYITDIPSLYFVNSSDHRLVVYAKAYGPITFKAYEQGNLSGLDADKFKIVSYKNILSANILSENSDQLNLSDPLTKGELARVCGFILGDTEDYADIDLPDVNEADKIYIKTAIKHGIFNYNGGNFNPGEPVKRNVLIYALTETLKAKGMGVQDPLMARANAMTDAESFLWMKENVQIALENGIINKEDTAFNPENTAKREHAIITIYRTLRALSDFNTRTEPVNYQLPLAGSLTNKIKNPKAKEIENLKTHTYDKSSSGLSLDWFKDNILISILVLLILILVLAIIIILIKGKNKTRKNISHKANPGPSDKPQEKRCPSCGKAYNDEKFCTACGHKLK